MFMHNSNQIYTSSNTLSYDQTILLKAMIDRCFKTQNNNTMLLFHPSNLYRCDQLNLKNKFIDWV